MTQPTKLAFEERYDDDSGVEFAVSFNGHEVHSNGCQGVVEFEHAGVTSFPVDRLDWLIERLVAIKELAT